jgi:hypothetical protein
MQYVASIKCYLRYIKKTSQIILLCPYDGEMLLLDSVIQTTVSISTADNLFWIIYLNLEIQSFFR